MNRPITAEEIAVALDKNVKDVTAYDGYIVLKKILEVEEEIMNDNNDIDRFFEEEEKSTIEIDETPLADRLHNIEKYMTPEEKRDMSLFIGLLEGTHAAYICTKGVEVIEDYEVEED